MKRHIIVILILSGIKVNAQLPTMHEVFKMLPDSAFTNSQKLTASKSFSIKERELILNSSDTSTIRLDFYSDSLHQLQFSGGDYISVQIQYWVRSKNEIYIAVIESNCDFVMCNQKNSFYKLKKGKLSPFVMDYFNTPLLHFFDSKALTDCGINPNKGCSDYTLSIEKGVINVHFQIEFTDKELMGENGKYVCLQDKNASLEGQKSVIYLFDGKKFRLILPH